MRNFPIVPQEWQAPKTENNLGENWNRNDGIHTYETKEGWKATKVKNGEYVKWSSKGYTTKEEAVENL
jgi:hypothetical protein